MDLDEGAIRPLAQQVPRRTEAGVVFSLPGREVEIGGDRDEIWAVLELCDGARTVPELAESLASESESERAEYAALIERLLAEGALVDCTQAYRLLHDQASVGSHLFRALGPEALRALGAERYAPDPDEVAGEPVALEPADSALLEIAARRASSWPGERRPVSFAELSAILTALDGTAGDARTLPSAGGVRPLIVHVAMRTAVGPLEPGLHWHDPERGALLPLSDPGLRVEDVLLEHEVSNALVAAGEPIVFVSADFERPSRKYANRGYRYALIEIGAAMQSAYLAAAEADVPIRAIGGIHDRLAAQLLGLGEARVPVLALLLGR